MRSTSWLAVLSLLVVAGVAPSVDELYNKNYYDLFGVSKLFDEKDLKKKYRKAALIYHPDRAPSGLSSEEKESYEKNFIRLALAYDVLRDPRLRARYDYLLTQGIQEYDQERDWTAFDETKGFGRRDFFKAGSRPRDMNAARKAYDEADEREFYSMLIAFSIAGVVACLPSYYMWKKKPKKKEIPVEQLKREQEALAEFKKAQEILKEEERTLQRELNEENKRLQKERAAERENMQKRKESGDEASEDDLPPKKSGGGGGAKFKCQLCHKSFKSGAQLDNHFNSKQHKKAEKDTARASGVRRKPGNRELPAEVNSISLNTEKARKKQLAKLQKRKQVAQSDEEESETEQQPEATKKVAKKAPKKSRRAPKEEREARKEAGKAEAKANEEE